MIGRSRVPEKRVTVSRRAAGFAVAALVALVAGCAQPKPPSAFETDFDEQAKPWEEIRTQLPPAPTDAGLVVFGVSGATQYHFALDATTLAIGTDGVFRYVLVATSPEGARNVTYEGIRCDAAQKKIYATGRADGTWVRARNAAWSPIEEVGNNRQHAALMKEYFCPDGYAARSVDEVLSRLRVKLPSTVW